jgi:hypothetical protein
LALRAKFDQFLPHLDERRRRIYLASEAAALGHGGITLVAAASGASAATVARGIAELSGHPLPTGRIRAPGAGRKPLTVTDPGLLPALEALIEPHTRGDPVSPLRCTTLSLRSLASVLTMQDHLVSAATVGRLLHSLGYSLQGTIKTTEGASHPDRDAQFTHINASAAAFLVEQDRTQDVLPHHRELAWQAPDQLRDRHRDDRRHDHPRRAQSEPNSTLADTTWAPKCHPPSSMPCRSHPTPSTAAGTTPWHQSHPGSPSRHRADNGSIPP